MVGSCVTTDNSRSPVSSATSRTAAWMGVSPPSRWPLGKPQLPYGSRISRKCVAGDARRNTTPPELVSMRTGVSPARRRSRDRRSTTKHVLSDLHCVRSRAFAQVVPHNPDVHDVRVIRIDAQMPGAYAVRPRDIARQRVALALGF